MNPQELITRSRALFERQRTQCLDAAIEATATGDSAEAQRQADWMEYYGHRRDLLDQAPDLAHAMQLVVETRDEVHAKNQARRAANDKLIADLKRYCGIEEARR